MLRILNCDRRHSNLGMERPFSRQVLNQPLIPLKHDGCDHYVVFVVYLLVYVDLHDSARIRIEGILA